MKSSFKTLSRRKFLKTGIFGGVIISVCPHGKPLDFPGPLSDPHRKPEDHLSLESSDRLLQIACTYGPEIGEIKEIKNGCF
jgi:hypothetical protein